MTQYEKCQQRATLVMRVEKCIVEKEKKNKLVKQHSKVYKQDFYSEQEQQKTADDRYKNKKKKNNNIAKVYHKKKCVYNWQHCKQLLVRKYSL